MRTLDRVERPGPVRIAGLAKEMAGPWRAQLMRRGLTAGARLAVVRPARGGAVVLSLHGQEVAVGHRLAAAIWVEVDEGPVVPPAGRLDSEGARKADKGASQPA